MSRIKSIDELVTSKSLRALNPDAFPHATAAKKAQAACISETLGVSGPVPNGTKEEPDAEWSSKPDTSKLFCAFCSQVGLPIPVCEFRFHPVRKWRADFAWPEHKLLLEVDGGAWTNGRHTRGQGFMNDSHKRNAAVLMGYRPLSCQPDELMTLATVEMIKEALR